MYIDVPAQTRGKNINCIISAKRLVVKVFDEIVIDGELEEPVLTDESMWTLISDTCPASNPQIVVTLEKTRKNWWKHIITTDPIIDTSLVDSTQRIDEYDEEVSVCPTHSDAILII